MAHVIITTCGTSLLTNRVSEDIRQRLSFLANHVEKNLSPEDNKFLDDHVARRRSELLQADTMQARRLSAELNGIIGWQEQVPPWGSPAGANDIHFLVHTGTVQGELAARAVGDWLRDHDCQSQLVPVPDLNTRSLAEFRVGATSLIRWCGDTLPIYRNLGWRVIFNLTGGFKSIQGLMQTIGMIWADEIIYIFEFGEELLRIPRLPIRLDVEDTVRRNLNVFRRFERGESLVAADCKNIPETMILQLEGRTILSEWGELLWLDVRRRILGERLLDTIEDVLIVSKGFRRDCDGLPADRLFEVNRALDQLSWKLRGGPALKSAEFKKLAGKPIRSSTHELYAWSDQNARRILGHFEQEQFMLDSLEKHL